MKFTKSLMLAVSLLLILAACGNNNSSSGGASSGGSSKAEPATIRVGVVCGGTNQIPVTIGVEQGLFAEAGLNVEKNCFESGADSVQALIGGSLDVNFGSYEHVLRQRANGLDVKAYGNFNNRIGYYLLVKSDSSINSVADLKGKTLGVTKTGSLSDSGLRMILEQENINPERDVEIVSAGSGATMLAALESGKVEAGMITEPNVSQMIDSGSYRLLVDPTFDYVGLVAMAKADWVEKNKDAMKTFLSVLKSIRDRIEAEPRWAAELVIDDYTDVSIDILEQALARWVAGIPSDLVITKEGADAVVASQLELGTISETVPFEDTIDLSLLPN